MEPLKKQCQTLLRPYFQVLVEKFLSHWLDYFILKVKKSEAQMVGKRNTILLHCMLCRSTDCAAWLRQSRQGKSKQCWTSESWEPDSNRLSSTLSAFIKCFKSPKSTNITGGFPISTELANKILKLPRESLKVDCICVFCKIHCCSQGAVQFL